MEDGDGDRPVSLCEGSGGDGDRGEGGGERGDGDSGGGDLGVDDFVGGDRGGEGASAVLRDDGAGCGLGACGGGVDGSGDDVVRFGGVPDRVGALLPDGLHRDESGVGAVAGVFEAGAELF